MIVAFLLHEVTALWDVSFAVTRRNVSPIEQHVHSFLQMIPLMAGAFVAVLHWPQLLALFGLGGEAARFDLTLKQDPLPVGYIVAVLSALSFLRCCPISRSSSEGSVPDAPHVPALAGRTRPHIPRLLRSLVPPRSGRTRVDVVFKIVQSRGTFKGAAPFRPCNNLFTGARHGQGKDAPGPLSRYAERHLLRREENPHRPAQDGQGGPLGRLRAAFEKHPRDRRAGRVGWRGLRRDRGSRKGQELRRHR